MVVHCAVASCRDCNVHDCLLACAHCVYHVRSMRLYELLLLTLLQLFCTVSYCVFTIPQQLSVVVSSNYVAQTIGCTVMGGVSDRYGRKPVIIGCLVGSLLSNLFISRSKSLT
jgi:MFS family permease